MTTRDKADRALSVHGINLLENPNVCSVSVIETETGECILEVGLVAAEGADNAEGVMRAPDEVVIPGVGDLLMDGGETIRIRKRIFGSIDALALTGRYRPALGGASCGPFNANWSGTLGARVDYAGKPCILSNWHVLYGGVGQTKDAVVQPGHGDGGQSPGDVIAHNLTSVLSTQVDAALAEIVSPADSYVGHGTFAYGLISGQAVAVQGMDVKKCGRTTEATNGRVVSTNASIRVDNFPGGSRVFENQIQMTAMAAEGDSGSIVLDQKNNAVGLLFAGNSSATYANKMDVVLRSLGLSIV